MRVIPVNDAVIVGLHFFPCDPFVEIHCGEGDNVTFRIGGTSLREDGRIVDYRNELVAFLSVADSLHK